MKPILRWAGSKYNQSKIWVRVQDLFEPYKDTHRLIEPFCGGLGMTVRLQPKQALLNDSNEQLIRLYLNLASSDFVQNLTENTESNYQAIRYRFNTKKSTKDFLWLNQCCFQGLYRENAKGDFNVPIGKNSKKILLQPKIINLNECRRILQNYTFLSCDFLECLDLADDQSFVYCDPPYDSLVNGFIGYRGGGFTWIDQIDLAKTLTELKCPVVASNLATDRIINLYTELKFNIELISAKRSVSANGDRTSVCEMLAHKGIK